MDKYKIEFIFNEENDINDILTKVLNKEIKKYLEMFYKNQKNDTISSANLSLQLGEKN